MSYEEKGSEEKQNPVKREGSGGWAAVFSPVFGKTSAEPREERDLREVKGVSRTDRVQCQQ